MIEVSIIIINYNTYILTRNCIKSIVEKTTCKYELILIDNASTEQDPVIFIKEFPGIKLIKSPVNLGFSKGINLGIQYANGEFILLNSDTFLLNNAIDLALERIKTNNEIGALSSQLVSSDGTLQTASNEQITVFKNVAWSLRVHHLLPIIKPKKIDLSSEHFTEWIWGTFMLIPKHVIEKFPHKRLHDNFFMYVEDRHWCYTIRKLGFKILYYPKAKIYHYISASSGINEELKYKNKILPNEFDFLKIEKGHLYACFYYLSISMFYLMRFKCESLGLAKFYFNFSIKRLINGRGGK